MIRSFKGRHARAVFEGRLMRGFPSDLFSVARRKLRMLDAAPSLDSLKVPPGNKLHSLTRDRAG